MTVARRRQTRGLAVGGWAGNLCHLADGNEQGSQVCSSQKNHARIYRLALCSPECAEAGRAGRMQYVLAVLSRLRQPSFAWNMLS